MTRPVLRSLPLPARLGRRGFTLVELLVVMSLVIVLAGITVAVAESGAFGSQKVVSGADRATGWLLIAKNRALRDGRPRGVRFLLTRPQDATPSIPNPANDPNWFVVREAQYIEVPADYDPGVGKASNQKPFLAFVYEQRPGTSPPALYPNTHLSGPKTPPNGQRVVAFFPTLADKQEFLARVPRSGMLLSLPRLGGEYAIDQMFDTTPVLVQGTTPPHGLELVLGRYTSNGPAYVGQAPASPPDYNKPYPIFTYPELGAAFSPTASGPPRATKLEYEWSVKAAPSAGATGEGGPQPLVGEPLLQLTGNTVIDVRVQPNADRTTYAVDHNLSSSNPVPGTSIGMTVVARPNPSGNPPTLPSHFDVVFAPSGQVLGADGGLVALWVRDPEKVADPRAAFDQAGEQVLVAVYTRTGLLATHPVVNESDPHKAAKDGLNSGL